ncbi:MAG: pyrroline-5-carboxylate reductase [Pseudomonadales bacterium]|nr:pyrroline-5-carboxylate reductase [Pseudomonadales bacterium]
MSSPHIAFIGSGNMARAIMGGLINNGFDASNISATGRSQAKLDQLKTELGIQVTTDNNAVIAQADVVILAIKPQQMQAVCLEIQAAVEQKKPLIISIAAGITIPMIQNWLSPTLSIVRCMPNTPSLVQCGASGLFANAACNTEQKKLAESLLQATGIVTWVDKEHLMDAVTAVSGSGPAYFFLVMEAMQEAGVKLGLSPETAKQLTLQTALGAAKMAQASDVETTELRKRVTSPGGTTAAALGVFEQQGLKASFELALKAADNRSKSLAKEME